MNVFPNNPVINLLPYDGEVQYFGKIVAESEATEYFDTLMRAIEWKNDEAMMFGRHIITKRKVAWYGDERYSYTYSKITKQALLWTPELVRLKEIVEQITGSTYNSCLLNLYHDGSEGMAWHSDDEKALGDTTTIASLTFGAERRFAFKHKRTKEKVVLTLEHGSLLMMKGQTQQHWMHRLPPTKTVSSPRINLTFRQMIKMQGKL